MNNITMKTRIFQPLWNRPNFFNMVLMCVFLCTMVLISLNISDGDTLVTRNISMRRPLIARKQYKDPFDLSKLAEDDLSQLIDMKDFKFLINSTPCQRSSPSPSQHQSASPSFPLLPASSSPPSLSVSSPSSPVSLTLETNYGSIDNVNSINTEGANSPVGSDSHENDVFLLIFIHSAPANIEKRKMIRDTWASLGNVSTHRIRRVFLFGLTDDVELQRTIEEENQLFGDVVQGNFLDTYRNLTYKHVMGLKWITYYCRSAKFILKADDDIFVDTIQLIGHLRGLMVDPVMQPSRLLNCFVIRNPYPIRSYKSKWQVTYEEYPGKYYPTYCFGWGFIMSPDVVFDLYLESRSTPYFWVDDVYVTGLLAQKVPINPVDLGPKLAITDQEIQRWVTNQESLTLPPLFARPAAIQDLQTIYDLWNKTIKYYYQS